MKETKRIFAYQYIKEALKHDNFAERTDVSKPSLTNYARGMSTPWPRNEEKILNGLKDIIRETEDLF
jgi:transcriptional regulator with XRE-family HTH domain